VWGSVGGAGGRKSGLAGGLIILIRGVADDASSWQPPIWTAGGPDKVPATHSPQQKVGGPRTGEGDPNLSCPELS